MSQPAWGSDPWYVVDAGYGRFYVRDRGGLIAEPPRPHRYDGQDARFEGDVARYKARINLIAAAPQLAEALEPFAKFACDEPCECNNCKARAALAEARGES